jgi:hypothetical protein
MFYYAEYRRCFNFLLDENFLCDIDSNPSSDEPDTIQKQGERKRKAYLRWSKGESDTIREYFKSWFSAEKNPGMFF